MKRILTASATALLLSAGAAAAGSLHDRTAGSTKDAPVTMVPAPAPIATTWTGLIVGGMVGGTFNNSKLDYFDHHDDVINCVDLNLGAGADGFSAVGLHAGGVLGYQRQYGNFVAGVEGWGGWSDAETEAYITAVAGFDSGSPNHTFASGDVLGSISGFVSVKQDYWYAGYAKLGYDWDGLLVSGLLGYKQAHLEGAGALAGWDDDIGGISGGMMVEKMVWGNIALGAYATYTAFEEKNYGLDSIGGIKLEMDGYDVGVRAIAKF